MQNAKCRIVKSYEPACSPSRAWTDDSSVRVSQSNLYSSFSDRMVCAGYGNEDRFYPAAEHTSAGPSPRAFVADDSSVRVSQRKAGIARHCECPGKLVKNSFMVDGSICAGSSKYRPLTTLDDIIREYKGGDTRALD